MSSVKGKKRPAPPPPVKPPDPPPHPPPLSTEGVNPVDQSGELDRVSDNTVAQMGKGQYVSVLSNGHQRLAGSAVALHSDTQASPAIQHSYKRPTRRSNSSAIIKPTIPPPAPPCATAEPVAVPTQPSAAHSPATPTQSPAKHKHQSPTKLQNVQLQEKKVPLFAFCCGLRTFRTDSPEDEVELPLRTEGTLPKTSDDLDNVFSSNNDLVVLPGGEISCRSSIQNMNTDSNNALPVISTSIIEKPVIQDVKILKQSTGDKQHDGSDPRNKNGLYEKRKRNMTCDAKTFQNEPVTFRSDKPTNRNSFHVRSQSVEDLAFCVLDLDLDLATQFERNKSLRSSFMGEDSNAKPPVLSDPGEFQTLLKHSKGEKIYSLPQPHCYGESTLKAVKRITEKYDTLQRWKIRAMSFREETLKSSQKAQPTPIEETNEDHVDSDTPTTIEPHVTVDTQVSSTAATGPYSRQLSTGSVLLSVRELQQLEMFYRGQGTEVYVCCCTAELLLGSVQDPPVDWSYTCTGVPLLVLNTGQARRQRQLTIVLADRFTAFPLWQDKVNYLTKYHLAEEGLYTMHFSESHNKTAGFKFHCTDSASQFQEQFNAITSNPNDDLWKVSQSDRSKKRYSKNKINIPAKGDISNPLNFSHMSCISPTDPMLLVNFSSFIPQSNQQQCSTDFRTRAYSG